jgi:hypothetical protein
MQGTKLWAFGYCIDTDDKNLTAGDQPLVDRGEWNRSYSEILPIIIIARLFLVGTGCPLLDF